MADQISARHAQQPALEQDSLTSTLPLEVDVEDGVVTLRGQVQSEEDAEHAQWLLGELQGVVDVVEHGHAR